MDTFHPRIGSVSPANHGVQADTKDAGGAEDPRRFDRDCRGTRLNGIVAAELVGAYSCGHG